MSSRLIIAVCTAIVLSVAATTLSFVLLPFRWPSPQAAVFDGALGIPDNPNDFRAAFESAAGEWREKTGFEFDVKRDPLGACDASGRLLGGAEFFSSDCGGFRLGRRVLALTETVIAVGASEGEDGEIRAVGITFNSEAKWDLYDGPWRNEAADFRRVALHELGHVAGLDHEDSPGITTIMRSMVGDITSLQPDDIDGLREHYPELSQNVPPFVPPANDADQEPVGLPPLNAPTDTPPTLQPSACLPEHLKLAGKFCKGTLGCFASAAKKPGTFAGCFASTESAFLGGSQCTTQPWADYIVSTLADIDAAIGDGIDPSQKRQVKLQVKLLKLAGKHCQKALAAESRDARKRNAGKLSSARSKARLRAVIKSKKAIAKSEQKGLPYRGPTGNAIADDIDSLIDEVAGK